MADLHWLKLDNAAKIYPAARRRCWTNVFRISFSLKEKIDPVILQEALAHTIPRFPSVAVRMKTGVFWYYLEGVPRVPPVISEEARPLNRMTFSDIRRCAFRVLYYQNRISVEWFHSITDGNGGMVFAKSLTAEYLRLKYRVEIPAGEGVLDLREAPSPEEYADCFTENCSPVAASRKEDNAYRLCGTKTEDGFLTVIRGSVPADQLHDTARRYGVTVTTFLSAVMMMSIAEMQDETVKNKRRRRPVRILIPVNLRNVFPSRTLRNFASYITPAIDPRLGTYSFDEMLSVITHTLGLEYTAKNLSAKFTANVRSEQSPLLRVMPLFIKNAAMKLVYNAVGERKSSICMSNLGVIQLPEKMTEYVRAVDFVLGVQADSPNNCGICTYGNVCRINFIRSIEESELERRFFCHLRDLGLVATIDSNRR